MKKRTLRADTVVIGGGPAGMMAAYTAAERGRRVILIEKNNRLGKKLLITGKGRCNVTNNCGRDELIRNVPVGGKFLYSAFSLFGTEDTVSFFESAGVRLKTERGNRVFPESDKALDIEAVLERRVLESGVSVIQGNVTGISKEGGFITRTDDTIIESETAVIATGGLSYPLTGSTGDGYRFAEGFGHTVEKPLPALIPIVTAEKDAAQMQGLSLKNVTLRLYEKGRKKPVYEELGEMLFTHFGVSGPLVLTASCYIKEPYSDYYFEIDLKPGLSEEKLENRLLRDFSENINKSISNVLSLLLPQKAISVIIKRSGISPDKKVNCITRKERAALIGNLKALKFSVSDLRPISEAIITSGGISVREINPGTMESKLTKGLYFAGEVIDVNAYTGGFNLQIAFSTGYSAGMNA
ncbi:MAG: NAD(P)/FAD-dependent oxidoreductase [Acutalibacteraceae bacterium]